MDNDNRQTDPEKPRWWRKGWKFDKEREQKAGEPWQDWTERDPKRLPEPKEKCIHTWQETQGYFICRLCGEVKRKPRHRGYYDEDIE